MQCKVLLYAAFLILVKRGEYCSVTHPQPLIKTLLIDQLLSSQVKVEVLTTASFCLDSVSLNLNSVSQTQTDD